jgi:hypothetical protein
MLGPCLDVYVVLACFGIVAVLGSMFGITLVLSLAYGSQGSLGGGGACYSYYHVLHTHVWIYMDVHMGRETTLNSLVSDSRNVYNHQSCNHQSYKPSGVNNDQHSRTVNACAPIQCAK